MDDEELRALYVTSLGSIRNFAKAIEKQARASEREKRTCNNCTHIIADSGQICTTCYKNAQEFAERLGYKKGQDDEHKRCANILWKLKQRASRLCTEPYNSELECVKKWIEMASESLDGLLKQGDGGTSTNPKPEKPKKKTRR